MALSDLLFCIECMRNDGKCTGEICEALNVSYEFVEMALRGVFSKELK